MSLRLTSILGGLILSAFVVNARAQEKTCEMKVDAVKIFSCGKALRTGMDVMMEKVIRISDGQILTNDAIAYFKAETNECQTEALKANSQK